MTDQLTPKPYVPWFYHPHVQAEYAKWLKQQEPETKAMDHNWYPNAIRINPISGQ